MTPKVFCKDCRHLNAQWTPWGLAVQMPSAQACGALRKLDPVHGDIPDPRDPREANKNYDCAEFTKRIKPPGAFGEIDDPLPPRPWWKLWGAR